MEEKYLTKEEVKDTSVDNQQNVSDIGTVENITEDTTPVQPEEETMEEEVTESTTTEESCFTLDNIASFKAVGTDGNETNVSKDELVTAVMEEVTARMSARNGIMPLSEISTLSAGTDQFEDQLPVVNGITYVRGLDDNRNPVLISAADHAKVVGGLIGIAGLNNNGLMPAGLFYKIPNTIYIESNQSYNLGNVNGLVGIRNGYSWDGYSLYWCSGGVVKMIVSAEYTLPQTVSFIGTNYILTNTDSARKRAYQIFVQNISI